MSERTDKLDARLPSLVEQLVASYNSDPRTQHIDSPFLPSRQQIVRFIELMLGLLYPGYFGRQQLTAQNISFHTGQLLTELSRLLAEQMRHCFACRNGSRKDADDDAVLELVVSFFEQLPQLRRILATDVQAIYDGDPAAKDLDEVIFAYPGLLAVTVYRMAHLLHELGVPLMPRIMTEYAHSVTGIDIHPAAQIGESFCIDHGTGVVIGETCRIGRNVKLYQGVTLGALSFPKDERGRIIRGLRRHPTLEDNVTVYSNASILGAVTIGEGAVIGGGVFLTRSVPAGCVVSLKSPELKYHNHISKPERKPPFHGNGPDE